MPVNFSLTLGSGFLAGILRYEENLDLKADSDREKWRRGEGRAFNKSELIKRREIDPWRLCVRGTTSTSSSMREMKVWPLSHVLCAFCVVRVAMIFYCTVKQGEDYNESACV